MLPPVFKLTLPLIEQDMNLLLTVTELQPPLGAFKLTVRPAEFEGAAVFELNAHQGVWSIGSVSDDAGEMPPQVDFAIRKLVEDMNKPESFTRRLLSHQRYDLEGAIAEVLGAPSIRETHTIEWSNGDTSTFLDLARAKRTLVLRHKRLHQSKAFIVDRGTGIAYCWSRRELYDADAQHDERIVTMNHRVGQVVR